MFFNEQDYCYLNGKIIKLKDAKISPFDLGFSRGYAVTEVMRTYEGKIFLFKDHFQRLKKAVKALRLNLKEDDKEIKKVIDKLMKKNNCQNAKVKLVLSPGIGKSDLELGKNQTLFIFVQEYHDFPKSFYEKGIKLITTNYQRNLSKIKSSNYIEAICFRKEMQKQKAQELLYVLNGKVFECSTSNIFLIKNNVLITPKDGLLPGVTRNFVLNFSKKYMKVIEKEVSLKDLLKVDEVFITATTKEIMPVVKIDNYMIGNGQVGHNTKKLQKIFKEELIKKLNCHCVD